ncbi:hypothetical protein TL18_04965 [Methanobrevibacter sp. YE315]|uniref:hypothetical protein n=1 Tax=Methanobrevibacter sp. YE315 TaxID=1609968 RepID=UPI000764EB27|nr:hypothetical protein [Methanobrevibacter sp. YE315]AMD17426.1 hypothetical protein TL18_04965 [Methanobrevibacter sp. YE315]
METKIIIIISILIVIICLLAGILFITLQEPVDYERIEITPNGTTIEIPTEKAKFEGEMNDTGAKMWSFKQGSLITYNSEEAANAKGISALSGAYGIKSIEDVVLTHFEKCEKIDGFTVYTLDGGKLGMNNRNTMYCIIIGNDTTHDNIVITVDNKDMALYMAKSVQYKAPYSNTLNNVTNNINNSNNNSNLVRFVWDDGTVEYFPPGTILNLPDGNDYRLNADGSLTKLPTSHSSSPSSNDNGKPEITIETTDIPQYDNIQEVYDTGGYSSDSSHIETTSG